MDFIAVFDNLSWDSFVQLTVNGLTLGSVYAVIALGYSMVYGILKMLNFAHGDVFMVGAFIGWGVIGVLGGSANPIVPVWLAISFMLLAAAIGCGVLGVVIERFAYRPLRDAPRIAPLISALGVSFFLQNSVLLLFSADFKTYNTFDFSGGTLFLEGVNWGPLHVSLLRIIVIGSAFAMMGIDVDRVIVWTFFIGSALAGVAGVLVGLIFSQINHFMGFNYGLKGFTAAVVGGIGNVPGAMLGGLLIGLAESYSFGYISDVWQNLIVFSILVAFMLGRPSGILGRADIQKV